jgi:hypothetical protein
MKTLVSRIAFFSLLMFAPQAWAQDDVTTVGEMVYRLGVLSSGQPLQGDRDFGVPVEGAEAACANCHRRSGLGTLEGRILIPPITGKYLFRANGSRRIEDTDLRFGSANSTHREPYNEGTLARAIREGIGREGQKLNPLMPRFQMSDATMASLITYLKTLSTSQVPGVSDDTLHFATIITPDADPAKRQGMLDVLKQFFADKNEFLRGGRRSIKTNLSIRSRVTRRWQLHVWQLTGPSNSWEQQLHQFLAAEPVFAVISGLGGKTWLPVHRFCESEAIPCLLPNADLPVVAENDFYPIYFNKGVLLEAGLMSLALQENRRQSDLKRVVQVYREGDVGEEAARALVAAGGDTGLENVNRVLKVEADQHELAEILKHTDAGDALVLWLRKEDMKYLPNEVVRNLVVYVSGLMGGVENSPLPAAWRRVARMTYPLDLPELRKARMIFPLGWFKIHNIPIVAERTQADTYLACGILAETLTEMQDSFVRDYLVERIENMLSYRTITGHYPRLGLAPGQRFASKGGYLTRFADMEGTRIVADGDWVIP